MSGKPDKFLAPRFAAPGGRERRSIDVTASAGTFNEPLRCATCLQSLGRSGRRLLVYGPADRANKLHINEI
jgi:hypothetical protein